MPTPAELAHWDTVARGIIAKRYRLGFPYVFSPSDVTGLQLWLKADAGTFQSDGGAAASSDGDPVGQWRDQSSNSNHMAQATASKRGTLKLNIQNSMPVVRLDGVDDFLRATFSVSQPIHIFAIANLRDASAILQRMFDGETNDVLEVNNGTTAPRFDMQANLANSPNAVGTTNFTLFGFLFNAASSKMRFNGVEVGTGNPGTNGFTALTLGCRGDFAAGFGQYDFGEFLVYDSEITGNTLASLESYLNARWGIF
jgi:hypothetical protein